MDDGTFVNVLKSSMQPQLSGTSVGENSNKKKPSQPQSSDVASRQEIPKSLPSGDSLIGTNVHMTAGKNNGKTGRVSGFVKKNILKVR